MSKVRKNLIAALFEGLNVLKYAEGVRGLWSKYCTILSHYFFLALAGSFGSWVVFVNQRWLMVTQTNVWGYWSLFFTIMMSYLIASIFREMATARSRKTFGEYWGRVLFCAGYLVGASMVMGMVGTFGIGLLTAGWAMMGIVHLIAGTALVIASMVILVNFILPLLFGTFYFVTGEPFRDSLLRGGGMLWHYWTFLIGLGLYNYLLQIAIHFTIGVVVMLLKSAGLDLLPFLPSVEWHAIGLAQLFYVGVLYLFFTKKKRYITAV